VIHATRRTAVLLLVLACVAAGCSRGGSATPSVKGMTSRANNWGKYGVTHNFAGEKIVKGSWKCTAAVDKSTKTATTSCTGMTTDGKDITLRSKSTFDQLKKRAVRALPGSVTMTVGTTTKTVSCVGSAC
jgi:hypothetical protein